MSQTTCAVQLKFGNDSRRHSFVSQWRPRLPDRILLQAGTLNIQFDLLIKTFATEPKLKWNAGQDEWQTIIMYQGK